MAPTYFRNTSFINGIEAGSLWLLQNQHFVLVDEDQHVQVPQSQAHHFCEATVNR